MPLPTHRDEVPSLNLTSMIDVLFLLIIFFMTGTKFAEMERKIELRVPRVGKAGHLPAVDDCLVLNVFRDGTITLNGRVIPAKELTATLRAARSNLQSPSVLIRADGGGDFQTVARVLNACRQAGLSQLAIAVSQEPARR